MKICLIFTILICLRCPPTTFATEVSETTNGVYLVISAVRSSVSVTNEPIRFDDRLVWMPFYDAGEIELTCANPAYGIRIKMTDVNGKDVPKTELGKTYGKKWDSLQSAWDSLENLRDARPNPFMANGSFKKNSDLGGARFLPPPQELFQIEKPGIYALEIQMQMLYPNSKSANKWHKDLFQFSPLVIKVEKPN